MDRYWLLTWTTWGSWLPGDPRGSRSPIRTSTGRRSRYNVPGTPSAPAQPALNRAVQLSMTAPPAWLSARHARTVLSSLQATADAHGWLLLAAAVMWNHAHLVVGVPGDPDPSTLLRDFKRSSSAALNRTQAEPRRAWWTRSGSRRRLSGQPHVIAAVRYVQHQHGALVTYHGILPGPGT